MKLTKIDLLYLDYHYYLTSDDVCYYMGDYTSNDEQGFGETKSLIYNFKKGPNCRPELRKYRIEAIEKVANFFYDSFKFDAAGFQSEDVCFVPVPPSKTKDNENYDDRMNQVLSLLSNRIRDEKGLNIPITDLITLNSNMEAVHINNNRPPPNELIKKLSLDLSLIGDVKTTIFLFDDMLTTGSHFKACKNLLLERFPQSQVIGVFIARRVPREEQ